MKKKALTAVCGAIAVLLLCGVYVTGCVGADEENEFKHKNTMEVIVGDFSLTVTLDKTEARIGDTVTATVVFKNLSDRDIEAELPDWMAAGGARSKEDILSVAFIPVDSEIVFYDIEAKPPLPKILIESGAVIERRFEYGMTGSGNLEVHAGAFFITAAYPTNSYGMQLAINPIKLKVR